MKIYNCNITTLNPPKNFIPYNYGDEFKNKICVDQCLAKEIENLWKCGIITLGCCCGHGATLGFIQVSEDCVNKMEKLGYQHYIYNKHFGGEQRMDAFIPKSTHHYYNGYRILNNETKTNYCKIINMNISQLSDFLMSISEDEDDHDSKIINGKKFYDAEDIAEWLQK